MKIGRNDPCHCGSGRKYKKCCLNDESLSQEFIWRRTAESRHKLIQIIMEFAAKKYGENSILEAWDEFNGWNDEAPEFDLESHHSQLFMPWFFYDWLPGPENIDIANEKYYDIPIGKALLIDKKTNKLSSSQREYVEKCLQSPFSFYEVLECRKGDGFQLCDLFTREEYRVVEKSGSESVEKGYMLFGKLLTMEDVTTLEACSPFAIPPSMKLHIIDMRNHIKKSCSHITNSVLKKYDRELLGLYHSYCEAILNPKPPRICNTDGDDMVPQKLIYQVASLNEAFEKLHHLDIVSTREKLLQEAVFDDSNRLMEASFSWFKKGNKKHPSWDNTVLGHIELQGSKMTISVNSHERAKKIKTMIKKLLGRGAIYKKFVIEDINSTLQKKTGQPQPLPEDSDDLMNNPEVRAKIAEMTKAHWADWVNKEISALGGKTPRQAAKTEDGRELLTGLLQEIERNARSRPQPGLDPEVFAKIRKDIGLQNAERE